MVTKKGIHYKVIDEYTLFYFRWIEPVKNSLQMKALKSGYWEAIFNTSAWYSLASVVGLNLHISKTTLYIWYRFLLRWFAGAK